MHHLKKKMELLKLVYNIQLIKENVNHNVQIILIQDNKEHQIHQNALLLDNLIQMLNLKIIQQVVQRVIMEITQKVFKNKIKKKMMIKMIKMNPLEVQKLYLVLPLVLKKCLKEKLEKPLE